MKKYDRKKEYNPIRRTAKRILSGDPLSDGRPLSELIEPDVFFHRVISSFLCCVWGRFWSICSSVRPLF